MAASPTSSSPTLALAQDALAHLGTRRLGRPMEGHAALASTNERALAWARAGAREGSTVVTDHQTGGRGRHGRRWHSQAGQNLTFSVVLRPTEAALPLHKARTLPAGRLALVALAGGLAVCDAVASVLAAPAPRLKWPNDVLLGGRKCCGVLAETASPGPARAAPRAVVLGIGLNVNQDAFPEMPAGGLPPTSLALAAGRPVTRAPLLAQLLAHLEARYLSLFEDGGRTVRDACEARLVALGEAVTVRRRPGGGAGAGRRRLAGTFCGLAADGAMRLRTDDGDERTLHAGDVTARQSR